LVNYIGLEESKYIPIDQKPLLDLRSGIKHSEDNM